MRAKILLLGCGNMAKALISESWHEHFSIDVFSPSGTSSREFVKRYGGQVLDRLDPLQKYDYLFLAFKPQQLSQVVLSLDSFELSHCRIISILASVSTGDLQGKFGCSDILRVMPNTPAQIGAGTLTYFLNGEHDSWKQVLALFANRSAMINCQIEREIDLSTPVTGSGPAFIFEWARVWEKFLMLQGFDQKRAKHMVVNTLLGSAKLMDSSSLSFEELRNQVTSKAGVTEQGLKELVSSDFEKIIIQSLSECLIKITELKNS